MFKKILFIFLILFALFVPKSAKAFYDPLSVENNFYGMGIVNHSDLDDVSNLVNSNGGDWGYVTIVAQTNNLKKEQWQGFFDKCRELHLIPIVRIATYSEDQNWVKPDLDKIDEQVNFLNSLNWVIQNRYVIIGNEPNHTKEWGGKISPEEYGLYLKTFSSRLKNSSSDYFVLNAGFDQTAPNSRNTMDEEKFIKEMVKVYPDIFEFIDGWNSHSYPNPGFSGSQHDTGRSSIKGYEWELNLIKSFGITKDFPVFITETGWIDNGSDEDKNAASFTYAFENVWQKDNRVIAVTPFVLNYAQDPFSEFSWKKENGSYLKQYESIKSLPKSTGKPKQIIKGEILFSFLNPFGLAGTSTRGYFLAKNTGQNIWENKNSVVATRQGDNIKIDSISMDGIKPFEKGIVAYTLHFPNEDVSKHVQVGLFTDGEFVDDVFKGKLVSFSIGGDDEKEVGFFVRSFVFIQSLLTNK